jgi:uncharacterized protein YhaN
VILRSIRVSAYGILKDRVFNPLSKLVVVYGPNEAGKTTLRSFVQDLLFGFRPAALDGHPYAARDGTRMGGAIDIEYAGGESAALERRLFGTPAGTLRFGDRTSKLSNRPTEGVGAITREIYESVYSLAREDLEFPETTWGEVKDRIIGTGGLKGLRPAREAADELEKEAKALWRDDKRGKDVAAVVLRERIRELSGLVREARERDEAIREKEAERARIAAEKEALEKEKTEILIELRRAERLDPLGKRIRRIEEDERIGGDPAAIAEFPEDIKGFFRLLDERIENLSGRIEEEKENLARCEERVKGLREELRKVLDRADAIEEATEHAAVLRKERADLVDLRSEGARLEGAIRERGRALFEDPDAALVFRSVFAREARARVHAYRASREKRLARDAAESAAGALPSLPSLLPVLGAGAIGLVLLLAALLLPAGGGRPFLLGAGAVSLLVGLLAGFSTFSARRKAASLRVEIERRRRAAEDALREEESRLAAVREALREPGALPSRLEEPDEALAQDLADLGSALDHREDVLRKIESTGERIRAREAEILSLCGELSLDVSEAREGAKQLRRVLEEAREADRLRGEAARAIPAIDARIRGFEEDRARARAERESVEKQLLALGAGDLDACVSSLKQKREAIGRAGEERRRLAEEGEDFEALAAEIRALSSPGDERRFSDGETVRLRLRRDAIERDLQENVAAFSAAGKEIEALRAKPPAAEIEGEKQALEEELAEVKVRRDRLALLARIMREADARYRADHEPDIIARAGELFSYVSGGRYERLSLDPEEDRLELLPAGNAEAVPAAPPQSRGTLDQLFLCLRFALVDHLEAGGESLPLFLDDVLQSWDEERRERGIEIIQRIAERRQVFFLTCHRDLFRRLAGAGATAVELAAPDAPGSAAESAPESRLP